MAKLVMSPEANADMKEIGAYIAHKLQNPDAAARLIRRIRRDANKLRSFPEMGTPLNEERSKIEYRYIICGSYLVFYCYEADTVYIDRILYGRRDYLALLFGDQLERDDEEDE